MLEFPCSEGPLTLDTDLCEEAINQVLLQDHPDRPKKPLRYWSWPLSPAEQNYDTTLCEPLAVVLAVCLLVPHLEAQWSAQIIKPLNRSLALLTQHEDCPSGDSAYLDLILMYYAECSLKTKFLIHYIGLNKRKGNEIARGRRAQASCIAGLAQQRL